MKFFFYCFLNIVFLQVVLLSSCSKNEESKKNMEKRIIKTEKAPTPIGPYSQSVMINNFLYVSGQIAIDPITGKFINSDIVSQTHLVMKNIESILKEANMNFENIVKTSIFLKDMNQFSKVNETYGSYFSGNYPARETVQVSKLPKDADLEISVIAYKKN